MKVVIVGAGEIGTHLASKLVAKNHSIVIIDSDESIAEELDKKIDGRVTVSYTHLTLPTIYSV